MRYALRGTDGEREREWRRGEASEEQGERRGELHDVELSVCTDVAATSAVVRNEIDGREKIEQSWVDTPSQRCQCAGESGSRLTNRCLLSGSSEVVDQESWGTSASLAALYADERRPC